MDSTRYIVRMIILVIVDIISFTVVMFYDIFAFSILFYFIKTYQKEYVDDLELIVKNEQNSLSGFFKI